MGKNPTVPISELGTANISDIMSVETYERLALLELESKLDEAEQQLGLPTKEPRRGNCRLARACKC
ncbi:MAG: hypothetical protein FWG65_00355 [Turicibacter sp.]|nr:hypothetical protein [Turicibacter sp.]